MAYKAKVRPKSEWQQDDCIGRWLGCRNAAVEEAVYGRAAIRCCRRERCVLLAVRLAVDQGQGTASLRGILTSALP
ncbi:MAG TPA: hypothetical protein VGX03_24700 [Candidatus Binatia bacterium]|nr:hypothetical protein [Candidatus Binatia bacterium]